MKTTLWYCQQAPNCLELTDFYTELVAQSQTLGSFPSQLAGISWSHVCSSSKSSIRAAFRSLRHINCASIIRIDNVYRVGRRWSAAGSTVCESIR